MGSAKTTGQQETNAALAALAATGNAFALGQLWEINQGLLRSMFWKWYPANKAVADAHGMTAEDFEQEGYFSIKYAAENYNPENGTFAGWLWKVVKWRMGLVLSNGHRRTVANKDGTRRTVSADPLNYCASLDAPATADDENSTTMGELLPDPAAVREMQSVEDRLYHEQMHNDLETALQKLEPEEESVLRYRFYEDKTLQEAAEAAGKTVSTVRAIEGRALHHLRLDKNLRRWREDFITTRAWSNARFFAWQNSGSIEERTIEALENRNLLYT